MARDPIGGGEQDGAVTSVGHFQVSRGPLVIRRMVVHDAGGCHDECQGGRQADGSMV